jgi:integrase/recombinase XerD
VNDLIQAHLDWARAGGFSPNTVDTRTVVLRKAARELPHGLAATDRELVGWLGNPRWRPKTRATYFEHLQAFFTWAVETDELDWNPMVRLKRPRVPQRLPRPCTDAQLATLLTAPQPHRLAVVLAAYAGLRCCEIATLTWTDVDEDQIRVLGKGGKTAIVDTHPRVWAELAGYTGTAPFVVQAGGWADPKRISCRAAIYFRRHFNLRVTLHRCRSWYGSAVLNETNNLEAARMALRHSSITSTQGYVLLRNGQRRHGILALPILDAAR